MNHKGVSFRPPLTDPINAMLSFGYTLLTNEAITLEGVRLRPQVTHIASPTAGQVDQVVQFVLADLRLGDPVRGQQLTLHPVQSTIPVAAPRRCNRPYGTPSRRCSRPSQPCPAHPAYTDLAAARTPGKNRYRCHRDTTPQPVRHAFLTGSATRRSPGLSFREFPCNIERHGRFRSTKTHRAGRPGARTHTAPTRQTRPRGVPSYIRQSGHAPSRSPAKTATAPASRPAWPCPG